MNNSKKFFILLHLIFIAFFVLVLRLQFLSVPFERDEGVRATIAQDQIKNPSKILYRDYVTNKPPAVIMFYKTAFRFFGRSIEAVRLFLAGFVLLAAWGIYLLSIMLYRDKSVALAASLFFGYMSISPAFLGHAANLEIFTLLPMILAAIVLMAGLRMPPEPIQHALFFLAGICAGWTFWIKQTGIFYIAFLLLYLVYYKRRQNTSIADLSVGFLTLLAGALLPCLYYLFYFAKLGALEESFYWLLKHGMSYLNQASSLEQVIVRFGATAQTIFFENILMWVAAGIAFFYYARSENDEWAFVLLWFVFQTLAVLPGFRFVPHYFILLIPPVALAAGHGIAYVFKIISRAKEAYRKSLMYMSMVGMLVINPLYFNFERIFLFSPDQVVRSIYSYHPFAESKKIGSYIRDMTDLEETILVYGDEAQVYFYADRPLATKHVGIFYLNQMARQTDRIQRAFIEEVAGNNPRYIVIFNYPMDVFFAQTPYKYMRYAIADIIKDGYFLDGYMDLRGTEPVYVFRNGVPGNKTEDFGQSHMVYLYRRLN